MCIDIITLLLVFALVFCFLPASVWADALDELPSESTEPEVVTLPSESESTEPTGSTTIIYVQETTEPTAPVYLDVIERSTSSIFHATLFGAFLYSLLPTVHQAGRKGESLWTVLLCSPRRMRLWKL